MTTRIVVIGNGGFAVNCLKVITRYPGVLVPLVVVDPKAQAVHGLLRRFCIDTNLPVVEAANINAESIIDAVRSASPDFLFSIYNMQIIKHALLEVPRVAAVNFHNGPLPRYRGVNVYSWAIINGESEHGVTWHLVDKGIDTGDILAHKMFPLSAHETPNTLIAKGFRAGVELLDEFLPKLTAGALTPLKQNAALATYYSRRDSPNGGRIDFRWNFAQIERFVRGLDFRPLKNSFVYPMASFRGRAFYPQSVNFVGEGRTNVAGTILDIGIDSIRVQTADAVVALRELLDSEHQPISPCALQEKLGFRETDVLE
jgi:methionyl-tRNA formyltransferase